MVGGRGPRAVKPSDAKCAGDLVESGLAEARSYAVEYADALREDAPEISAALDTLCGLLDLAGRHGAERTRELLDAAITALLDEVGLTDTAWLMM